MNNIRSATFDPARRLDLYFRVKRVGSKTFRFIDGSGAAIDISAYDFQLFIKRYEGDNENTILLTVGSGLTVGGSSNDTLTASVTVAQTNIREGEYYWELYRSQTSKTYLSGIAVLHNGKFDGVPENIIDQNVTISDGSSYITIQINDTGTNVEIPLVTFSTALTFDYDKDLETVSGGTRTFTLASSGHLNGVGIVARINDPVAVNFPAGFELVSGSDSISSTDMNIIIMRYFSDYDGLGNDKVLYTIKNQTSL